MEEPRSSSAAAPDTASSPAPPDAQQISSDPEPDADDWDIEPGSRKGGSGAAPGVAEEGGGAVNNDELEDLKRISEESRNMALSWEPLDEEEFGESGDEDDEDDGDEDGDGDGDGDGDDVASLKGTNRGLGNVGGHDRRVGDDTSSVGRCVV